MEGTFECMEFYKDTPQCRRMLEVPHVQSPKPLTLADPKLPVDDSVHSIWEKPLSRRHPG